MVNTFNPVQIYRNYKNAVALNSGIASMTRTLDSFLVGISKDGARDIYAVFGYKRDNERSFRHYYDTYRLQDVANRVVNCIPRSCWRDGITIKEGDNKVIEDIVQKLTNRGLFKQIEKADILNRIGRFSIMYIGIPGQISNTPLTTMSGTKGIDKVFFVPFGEDGIEVSQYEKDIKNERYGQPVMYKVRVIKRSDSEYIVKDDQVEVHWSRVVHISEGSLDSELEGLSALEPILNRLNDLDKAIGGSAEAFFRNARGKMALQGDPKFKVGMSDEQIEALKVQVQEFQNNWNDVLRLQGLEAKTLDTPQADPTGTVNVALRAISGQTGIPMRTLTGEGAGQLAGDEDKASYNQLISDRQKQLCSTWLMRVFEILTLAGIIEFKEEYIIEWPVNEVLNEKDQADVKRINAQALYAIAQALDGMSLLSSEYSIQQAIEEIMKTKYKPEMVNELDLITRAQDAENANVNTETIPESPTVD